MRLSLEVAFPDGGLSFVLFDVPFRRSPLSSDTESSNRKTSQKSVAYKARQRQICAPLSPRMTTTSEKRRGALIVLEGVDRSGKSTQCKLLAQTLVNSGINAVLKRFPDRTTTIGTLINSYLTTPAAMNDRVIHLLFAANRWEAMYVFFWGGWNPNVTIGKLIVGGITGLN